MTAPAPAPAAPAADGDQGGTTPPTGTTPPAAPVVPPGATIAGQTPANPPDVNLADVDQVDKLPKWAQKIINDARTGEASYRTKATEAAERTKAILKAAGLEPEEVDPAKITAELETERKTSRQTAVELAVFRAAHTAGGDADALLDSRAFLDKVRDLDPKDSAAIRAAIADAVTENPRLAAPAATTPTTPIPAPAPAAGVSGADFTGGTGAAATQLTREQLAGMTSEEILKAHAEGRLANITGKK